VVNLSGSLNAKKRISEGTSLGSIRLWVAKRRHDGLTDGLGSLDHYLKNVDVLILPIESILTRVVVDAIVGKYDPKAVIPAHYSLNGLTTDVSGLESADEWVNDQEKVHHADVRRLDRADLILNAAELKGSHHRVYYFGDHFEKK